MNELKFEVGKYYCVKDSDRCDWDYVKVITLENPNVRYPILVNCLRKDGSILQNEAMYTENGAYFDNGEKDSRDLVSEYEPTQDVKSVQEVHKEVIVVGRCPCCLRPYEVDILHRIAPDFPAELAKSLIDE